MRNLGALGSAVAFVSVVGDDAAGSELTGLIGGQPGVEPWLLVQGQRRTTEKTRFIAQGGHHGHPMLRADREETAAIHPKLADRLVRIARDAMAATTVTVLSDYRKGVLAGDIPARLIGAARQTGPAHRRRPARPRLRALRRRRRAADHPPRPRPRLHPPARQRRRLRGARPSGAPRCTTSARCW